MTSRRPHEPLPLEARKVLWNRIWDRLLAAPPDANPPLGQPDRTGRPADSLTGSIEEPGR